MEWKGAEIRAYEKHGGRERPCVSREQQGDRLTWVGLFWVKLRVEWRRSRGYDWDFITGLLCGRLKSPNCCTYTSEKEKRNTELAPSIHIN
eukprot:1388854-Amorphochlora_amoeboformis.AAC.1